MLTKMIQLGMGWFGEEPGGANRFFFDLTQELDRRGTTFYGLVAGSAEVKTASDGSVTSFAEREASLFKRWAGVRKQFTVASRQWAEGKESCKASQALVASHFALYAFPLIPKLKESPHVVHFHGPWCDESAAAGAGKLTVFLKCLLEKGVYQTGDAFIVLSQAFREVLHGRFGIPKDKIHVIPGGVDCERFAFREETKSARTELGWPLDRKIVVCVRRLQRRMGLSKLVSAVSQLREAHPNLLVMIAGKGPLRDELAAQISTTGLDDHVQLLGYVSDDDLPKLYAGADLSVVPTDAWEGFGLITLESLATGTPVLVSPVGGLPEAVGGLSEDLVLPDTSLETLVAGLDRALSHPQNLPSRQACRSYVEKNFRWAGITDRILRVYADVAASYGIDLVGAPAEVGNH